MTFTRSFGLAAVSIALVTLLTGCFGGAPAVAPADSDLAGTSWGGTDSDGDVWGLEFQDDGTIGLTYNGNDFDDDSDKWQLAGSTLTVRIAFDDGAATLTGPYTTGAESIDFDGSGDGGISFTLTVTPE